MIIYDLDRVPPIHHHSARPNWVYVCDSCRHPAHDHVSRALSDPYRCPCGCVFTDDSTSTGLTRRQAEASGEPDPRFPDRKEHI